MKIIENCISKEKQEMIIDRMLYNTDNSFPWFYQFDITDKHTKNNQGRPGFSHNFVEEGKVVSHFLDVIIPILEPYTRKPVYQARTFLQVPLNLKLYGKDHDSAHVDLPLPHTVYLYYVVDADGDTIFFKGKKIVKRVTPKQGTLVKFDGQTYHASEQPKKHVRCVVNFDIEKHEY